MSNTITNERNIVGKIENYLKSKKLVFYKREEESLVVFLLPYRFGKDGETYTLDINLSVSKNTGLCKMFFKCKLSTEQDYSKDILDMNSKLHVGNLSVASESEYVLFSLIFEILDDEIEAVYEKYLYQSFYVLLKLWDKKIIESQDNSVCDE